MGNTEYEHTSINRNYQSSRYRGTSNDNAQLFEREQGQSRINENRQTFKDGFSNKQKELDSEFVR